MKTPINSITSIKFIKTTDNIKSGVKTFKSFVDIYLGESTVFKTFKQSFGKKISTNKVYLKRHQKIKYDTFQWYLSYFDTTEFGHLINNLEDINYLENLVKDRDIETWKIMYLNKMNKYYENY